MGWVEFPEVELVWIASFEPAEPFPVGLSVLPEPEQKRKHM